jgi:DNA-binding MarR family transcriptional regulator
MMYNKPGKRHAKPPIPAHCDRCGGPLKVLRNSERVLIRCERCGERIFSHYAAPPTAEIAGAPTALSAPEEELFKTIGAQTQAVYLVLRTHTLRYGYAPTVREIARALGRLSANAVTRHLNRLAEVGLIEREPGRARAIRLPHVA